MSVTLAMLVKDPPLDRLALLVEYLRPVVSEFVIVVDDRTAVEAADMMSTWANVKLVPFAWVDDFAEARNAALPHCHGDWILIVDPDELPSLAMVEHIREVDAGALPDAAGVLYFTSNFFSGERGPEWEEHWHCRLFRSGRGRFYRKVDELVALDGRPEDDTRCSPLLPKAPKAAYLIHSKGAA
jgi:glycosyltransferase involved in cell wall biosynthesis